MGIIYFSNNTMLYISLARAGATRTTARARTDLYTAADTAKSAL